MATTNPQTSTAPSTAQSNQSATASSQSQRTAPSSRNTIPSNQSGTPSSQSGDANKSDWDKFLELDYGDRILALAAATIDFVVNLIRRILKGLYNLLTGKRDIPVARQGFIEEGENGAPAPVETEAQRLQRLANIPAANQEAFTQTNAQNLVSGNTAAMGLGAGAPSANQANFNETSGAEVIGFNEMVEELFGKEIAKNPAMASLLEGYQEEINNELAMCMEAIDAHQCANPDKEVDITDLIRDSIEQNQPFNLAEHTSVDIDSLLKGEVEPLMESMRKIDDPEMLHLAREFNANQDAKSLEAVVMKNAESMMMKMSERRDASADTLKEAIEIMIENEGDGWDDVMKDVAAKEIIQNLPKIESHAFLSAETMAAVGQGLKDNYGEEVITHSVLRDTVKAMEQAHEALAPPVQAPPVTNFTQSQNQKQGGFSIHPNAANSNWDDEEENKGPEPTSPKG